MRHPARVISITSGKGGVGKTHTTINLALALQSMGKQVLVLDADLGLANVDVMLGIKARYTLADLFSGSRHLEEILVEGPRGIAVLPAASGVEALSSLSAVDRAHLMSAVEDLAYGFDYLLIDTQAGVGSNVTFFTAASHEIVCVINHEPTSLTDAYAVLKVLHQNYGEKSVRILANNVPDAAKGEEAFQRLSRSVERFLHMKVSYLGDVPQDGAVNKAICSQRATMDVSPRCPAAQALREVARRLDADFGERRVKGGVQFFFRQLLAEG